MKKLAATLLVTIAVAGQPLAQSEQEASTIEVYNGGEVIGLEEKELALKFWLQQLMLSALYRNVVQESSLEEWQQYLSAPSRVHCRYPSVVTMALPERPPLSFEEALLPLPSDRYPDYILIKRGERIQRLAKYDPWVLHKLVSEAKLPLYAKLSNVERALF